MCSMHITSLSIAAEYSHHAFLVVKLPIVALTIIQKESNSYSNLKNYVSVQRTAVKKVFIGYVIETRLHFL